MRRVLVTGHTGFLGRALTKALDAAAITWAGASRVTGHDLQAPETLTRLSQAEVIVHLAGMCNVSESWNRPAEYHRANVSATVNLMEHARSCGARVIFASTYLYGQPKYLPIDETHPVRPNNPYAWTKLQAEAAISAYATFFGTHATILRIFNIFGPGQRQDYLIPTVLRQIADGGTVSLANLAPRRDYLWLDDFCAAIVAVVQQEPAPNETSRAEIYNLGSGKSHSVTEILETAFAVSGRRPIEDRGEARPGEIADCVCDATRFRRTFGWSPSTSLEQGLARLLSGN